jgi:hypothetical protein
MSQKKLDINNFSLKSCLNDYCEKIEIIEDFDKEFTKQDKTIEKKVDKYKLNALIPTFKKYENAHTNYMKSFGCRHKETANVLKKIPLEERSRKLLFLLEQNVDFLKIIYMNFDFLSNRIYFTRNNIPILINIKNLSNQEKFIKLQDRATKSVFFERVKLSTPTSKRLVYETFFLNLIFVNDHYLAEYLVKYKPMSTEDVLDD